MKPYNKVFAYIVICFMSLSAVLNILYIADAIGESWVKIGFAVFMLFNTFNIIVNSHTAESKKSTRKFEAFLLIFIALIWLITYLIASFR